MINLICGGRFAAVIVGAVALQLAGCGSDHATGSAERPPHPQWAVVGMVMNAITGEGIAGAAVEVLGMGTGVTDSSGMYRIGENYSVNISQRLVIRAEARGFAMTHRELPFGGKIREIPALYMVPVNHAVQVGTEGGAFTFPGGATLRVPAGAVESRSEISVTVLPRHGLGGVQVNEDVFAVGALYISPSKFHFTRSIELSVPLDLLSASESRTSVLVFNEAKREWEHKGFFALSREGFSATIAVQDGGLFVYAVEERKYVVEEAAGETAPAVGGWVPAGECLPPGPVMSGDYTFNAGFNPSPSLDHVPEYRDFLYTQYGGSKTSPSQHLTTVPDRYSLSFEKRPLFVAHTRQGKIWYTDTPNITYLFDYFFLQFDRWELRITEVCSEDQGIVA